MEAIIKSIKRQYVLDDDEYKFILDHLNQPFCVLHLGLNSDGGVYSISLNTGDYDVFDGIITLFVGIPGDFGCSNGIKYELIGNLQMHN